MVLRPASAVSFLEAVPTNTTFASVSAPAGWTCTAPAVGGTGNVTCTDPALAAGASANHHRRRERCAKCHRHFDHGDFLSFFYDQRSELSEQQHDHYYSGHRRLRPGRHQQWHAQPGRGRQQYHLHPGCDQYRSQQLQHCDLYGSDSSQYDIRLSCSRTRGMDLHHHWIHQLHQSQCGAGLDQYLPRGGDCRLQARRRAPSSPTQRQSPPPTQRHEYRTIIQPQSLLRSRAATQADLSVTNTASPNPGVGR